MMEALVAASAEDVFQLPTYLPTHLPDYQDFL